MTLISEPYRELQRELHATTRYGVTAPQHMEAIRDMARAYDMRSILDYGSGPRAHVKEMLGKWFDVRSYDPCVPNLSMEPREADMLVCVDVLEHIEPKCLEDVLDHMARLTRRAAFITIATGPAGKTLSDGRNAHLIQQGERYWLPKLMERWKLRMFQHLDQSILCVCETRP